MITARDTIEERINRTIVGRSRETEIFKKQFDRVLEGGMGLTVVSGGPGIGKSFFVERAAGLFTGGGATYAHGKFRQYDKNPLAAISEVIEQMVRHILTLPAEPLQHIKSNLKQNLSADAAIVVSICPSAQILLGTQKAVNADSLEQLKYRVRKAVCRFLETASTALFPLIVLIDDLQWADALSVNIIETICQDYGSLNLHLVLVYRDDDTGKTFLNPAKLPERDDISIELGGLNYEDIEQYVRLILEQNVEHKEYLVRILYGLTMGIPFNISRILRLLLHENVLTWFPANKSWQIRFDRMKKLNLPADIETLLTRQIDELEKEDKELLNLIACCGDISLELLRSLTGAQDALLNARLNRLCENSLLVKIVRGDRPQDEVRYGFAHDIVLKLAYNNLEASERSKIHYHIAETLTELKNRPFAAGGGLAVATHLLRVDMPLLRQGRTEEWIGELFRTGLAARQRGALEQTLEIFERCADLLSFCEPEEKSRLSLDVLLELSECRFICGQTDEAKEGFEALMAKYPETDNQIRIKRKYINLCACNGDFEKVMELGLQILAHLNFKLDPGYLIIDLMKSLLLFSAGKINRLKNAPAITDQRLLHILETLTVMAPSANRMSDRMSAMISLKLAILSSKHGNSDYAPVAYAAYAYVLFHILKDHKKGKRLLEVVLALLERCENASSKSAAYCILGSLVHHWSNPLIDTVACLEQSVGEGEKEGASLYGSYAITFTIITKYMMGTPLNELKQYIDDCRRKQKRLEHYLTYCIYDIYANHIRRLEEGAPPEEGTLSEEDREYRYKELFEDTIKLNGDMIALQRLYLEGQMEKAYRLAEDIAPKVSLHEGFVLNVEFLFYSILARLSVHQDLPGTEKRRNKKMVKKQLKKLKYWVSVYPDNHRARYLLAQAEYDALFAPGKASDRLYREATELAGERGNLSLEALSNLLAAKYHRDNHKLCGFYAAEAASLYKKWGAAYIGGLVAPDTGLPAEAACSSEEPAVRPGEDDGKKAGQNILLHLNIIENMGEDEGYLYLLDLLTCRKDADYCAVFFEKSDEMYLKYEKRRNGEPKAHQTLINMNHLSDLPYKIIRYVARTETEILMDGKIPPGIFANDPYLAAKGALSLVCLPMKYLGVLIGIIYIEKTGRDGFGDNLPPS